MMPSDNMKFTERAFGYFEVAFGGLSRVLYLDFQL